MQIIDRLCWKEQVESVNSASPLPVVQAVPSLSLQSFLELVSSLILVTGGRFFHGSLFP